MSHDDYTRVASAIEFIQSCYAEQPTLSAIADHVGLSDAHLQRLFKRWAGVSPKRFVQFLSLEHAKQQLLDSRSVLDASFDVGLSGPSRLHDLFVNLEAVTPGEFKNRLADVCITHGFGETPFGSCFLAQTDRGVCALEFVNADSGAPLDVLQSKWRCAAFERNDDAAQRTANCIFSNNANQRPVCVTVQGTNFQIQVWRALLRIPDGCVTTYSDLATRIGKPKAARAVAGAVAANRVGVLIPCHRVLRQTGLFSEYRWGPTRKKAILAREAARQTVGGSDAMKGGLSSVECE